MPSKVEVSRWSTDTVAYYKLKNRLGWRCVAKLDHKTVKPSCATGWLTWYAWNLVRYMKQGIRIQDVYEALLQEKALFDSISIKKGRVTVELVKLTPRKTRSKPLYSIRIGGFQPYCVCAIFEPSGRSSARCQRGEEEP